jgi:hypothetical protein
MSFFADPLRIQKHYQNRVATIKTELTGSFPAAQYVYYLREFAGFWFPTKRRAHPRNADLTAEKHRTYVWIDVAEVAIGEED